MNSPPQRLHRHRTPPAPLRRVQSMHQHKEQLTKRRIKNNNSKGNIVQPWETVGDGKEWICRKALVRFRIIGVFVINIEITLVTTNQWSKIKIQFRFKLVKKLIKYLVFFQYVRAYRENLVSSMLFPVPTFFFYFKYWSTNSRQSRMSLLSFGELNDSNVLYRREWFLVKRIHLLLFFNTTGTRDLMYSFV